MYRICATRNELTTFSGLSARFDASLSYLDGGGGKPNCWHDFWCPFPSPQQSSSAWISGWCSCMLCGGNFFLYVRAVPSASTCAGILKSGKKVQFSYSTNQYLNMSQLGNKDCIRSRRFSDLAWDGPDHGRLGPLSNNTIRTKMENLSVE